MLFYGFSILINTSCEISAWHFFLLLFKIWRILLLFESGFFAMVFHLVMIYDFMYLANWQLFLSSRIKELHLVNPLSNTHKLNDFSLCWLDSCCYLPVEKAFIVKVLLPIDRQYFCCLTNVILLLAFIVFRRVQYLSCLHGWWSVDGFLLNK